MPKFEGTESKKFTVRAPIAKVAEVMSDPNVFHAFFADLDRHEKVNDTTYRWVLEEKNEKGVKFSGDYTVEYTANGTSGLTWKTVSNGNMSSTGTAKFREISANSTEVDYTETIVCDMDVNRLLAKVIRPIVNREIAKGVSGYLDRVKAHLES